MGALVPILIVALAAAAPVGAFLVIALVSLRDTEPTDRVRILRELAAFIPWGSGQSTEDSRPMLEIQGIDTKPTDDQASLSDDIG